MFLHYQCHHHQGHHQHQCQPGMKLENCIFDYLATELNKKIFYPYRYQCVSQTTVIPGLQLLKNSLSVTEQSLNTPAKQAEEAAKQHQYSCIESSKLINKEINLPDESQLKKEVFNKLLAMLPTCSKMEELEKSIKNIEKRLQASEEKRTKKEIRAWLDEMRGLVVDKLNENFSDDLDSILKKNRIVFKHSVHYFNWSNFVESCYCSAERSKLIVNFIYETVKNLFDLDQNAWDTINNYYKQISKELHKPTVEFDKIKEYIDLEVSPSSMQYLNGKLKMSFEKLHTMKSSNQQNNNI